MVSMLALNAVDRKFEPRLVKPKNKISICYFSAKHEAIRSKSKDWLAWNQNNLSSGEIPLYCCFSELALYKSI